MYSRSYGSIETERKTDGISIPANYNGSLYQKNTESSPQANTLSEQEQPPIDSSPGTETSYSSSGLFGGILEKFTAEDIILFILVFSLLKEDGEAPGSILAVILALLLL